MTKTIKLYEQDAFLKTMTAEVLACEPYKNGYATVLNQTIFYPEGGGQPSDQGTLGGLFVRFVFVRDDVVYHVTDQPFTIGEAVHGEINWARRFDFMQQHTGEHITTGQAFRLFGANNVGFHLSEQSVMLDVDKELDAKAIATIETAANRAIYENAPITARYPSAQELNNMQFRSKPERLHTADIRIVEVEGYDCCACCGTHLLQAGQVGLIKITDFQKHKSGTRIIMVAGGRALADYALRQTQTDEISALLSAKTEKTAEAVKRVLAEQEETKAELATLKSALIAYKVKDIPITETLAFYHEPSLSPDTLRRIALALMEQTSGMCAVFSKDETTNGSLYKYAVGSTTTDMRAFGKEMNTVLNGRGGGSKELIQGSVQASLAEIEEYFKNL